MKYLQILSLIIICNFLYGKTVLTATNDDCKTPYALKAEPVTDSSVKLSWSAISGANGYLIRIKEGDDNPYDFDLEKTISGNSYLVQGLKPNQHYEFRLRTLCGDDHSDWTDDFYFETEHQNDGEVGSCAIPTGLSVTNITNTSATVSWDAVEGVDNYEVEVEDGDNTPAYELNRELSATTIEVTGLSPDGEYKVKVKSKCSGGNNSEYTEWVFFNATPGDDPGSGGEGGPCAIPTGLSVTNITNTSATVSWDAVEGVDNYEVEVEDGDNTPAYELNRELSATTIEVTGLSPNGEYKVKVKSKCSGGNNSEYTEWVFFNATPGDDPGSGGEGGPCAIPTGLSVTNITNTSATVSWDAVEGVDNYEVEVEDGDNTPAYELNRELSATTIEVTGLSPNGEYKVKVKSKCSGGNNSEYTEWVFFNATPGDDPGSGGEGGPCAIPTGLSVTNITNTSATVSWDAVEGVDNYEVEVEDGDNTQAYELNRELSATTIEVTGLSPDGEYKVKVKSKCSGGNNSEYTEWVFFETSSGDDPNSGNDVCSIPDNLNAFEITDTTAILEWAMNEGTQNYTIQVEAIDENECMGFKVQIPLNYLKLLDLQPNSSYRFRVMAHCEANEITSYSDWYEFSTLAESGLKIPSEDNKLQSAIFSVYPNPVYGRVNLKINDAIKDKVTQIEFLDLSGRLLKSVQVPEFKDGLLNVNLGDLQPGLYLISLRIGTFGRHTQRLVVRSFIKGLAVLKVIKLIGLQFIFPFDAAP